MKKKLLYIAIVLVVLMSCRAHLALDRLTRPAPIPDDPQRIVSLAPSITETLYALGLGDRVAGVTRFCAYPPEVQEKPKIAGFGDVNYEAVLRLKPDLIVIPVDQISIRANLEQLGLAVMTFDTRTLSGFKEAVSGLGKNTGRQKEADAVLDKLHGSLAEAGIRAGGGGRPPRVLFTIMHSYEGLGHLAEVHAIGRDGFYSELVAAAGGVNAYAGDLAFPRLSREAIVFLNPDVIIDAMPAHKGALEAARRDWQSLGQVNAIRHGRLHFFTDAGDTVPGPRSCKTVERLSQVFYPRQP